MPWCERCSSYRAPSALSPDGRCRSCGSSVSEETEASARSDSDRSGKTLTTADLRTLAGEEAPGPVPWHFKLMVVMLVGYLGWRVVQIFA